MFRIIFELTSNFFPLSVPASRGYRLRIIFSAQLLFLESHNSRLYTPRNQSGEGRRLVTKEIRCFSLFARKLATVDMFVLEGAVAFMTVRTFVPSCKQIIHYRHPFTL